MAVPFAAVPPAACVPVPFAPFAESALFPPDVSAELLLACFPGRNATISTMAITPRMIG
jgi:hypothetical protein